MRNLERRIERAEQAVGLSGRDDPRAYTYPNSAAEFSLMCELGRDRWQQFLRTRHSKSCPEFWDWLDQTIDRLSHGELRC
jgi:hypothetical protein